MSDKVGGLAAQNDALRAQLAQMTTQYQTAQGRINELTVEASNGAQTSDKVTALQTQNDTLRAQLAQTASQADKAQIQLSQLATRQAVVPAPVVLSDPKQAEQIAALQDENNRLKQQQQTGATLDPFHGFRSWRRCATITGT